MRYSTEDAFRQYLELVAQLEGKRYTQIPDVSKAAYAINKHVPAVKRPCDGVLDTLYGMAWLELKIQNTKLSEHQITHLQRARKLHGNAWVLRAKHLKKTGLLYYLETEDGETVFSDASLENTLNEIEDLILINREA
jgi:hypothetical protein